MKAKKEAVKIVAEHVSFEPVIETAKAEVVDKKAARKEKILAKKIAKQIDMKIVMDWIAVNCMDQMVLESAVRLSAIKAPKAKRVSPTLAFINKLFDSTYTGEHYNTLHEDEIWKRARIGRREMKGIMNKIPKLTSEFIVTFDQETGQYHRQFNGIDTK